MPFIEGVLYKNIKHSGMLYWLYSTKENNDVIFCRANAFLFYEEKEDFYLFYSVSEKALIRASKPWAVASMKEIE